MKTTSFTVWRSQLLNRRLISILLLGFSSGLPLALTSSTLQAWYTMAGVDILTIGFLGLVGQPYLYKFLWAPLMDRFQLPWVGDRFSRRRGWMLLTQLLLCFSIALMAWFDPAEHPYVLGFIALWVAFLSASQDISIDAYRADLLKPPERGLGAAMAVTGYRLAMVVSGAFALIFAAEMGWHLTYLLMAAIMVVGMITSFIGPEPTYQAPPPNTLKLAVVEPFRDILGRTSGWYLLLFVVLYKLSYESLLSMTPTFLLRELGFTLVQVGAINKGMGFAALMLGIFLGGLVLLRLGVLRALLIFGFLQAFSNLGYMLLAFMGKNLSLLVAAISFENFFAGMEAAAFVAFLMAICNHRYTATQFALLSALATLGRVFMGPLGAMIIIHSSWSVFYLVSFLMIIPALAILWMKWDDFLSMID